MMLLLVKRWGRGRTFPTANRATASLCEHPDSALQLTALSQSAKSVRRL